MDPLKIGQFIREHRVSRSMTQRQLAETLDVTAQAISKWERGLGCPDVSLLSTLAETLDVPIDALLSERVHSTKPDGGSMRTPYFYVCPSCGNLVTTIKRANLSCCGRSLHPCSVQKADSEHCLTISTVEDEWFLTSGHAMTKEHHLAFVVLASSDQMLTFRRWPEWDFQLRIPRRLHGYLYWYCTQHGLYRQLI